MIAAIQALLAHYRHAGIVVTAEVRKGIKLTEHDFFHPLPLPLLN